MSAAVDSPSSRRRFGWLPLPPVVVGQFVAKSICGAIQVGHHSVWARTATAALTNHEIAPAANAHCVQQVAQRDVAQVAKVIAVQGSADRRAAKRENERLIRKNQGADGRHHRVV